MTRPDPAALDSADMSVTVNRFMVEATSRAVEGGEVENPSLADPSLVAPTSGARAMVRASGEWQSARTPATTPRCRGRHRGTTRKPHARGDDRRRVLAFRVAPRLSSRWIVIAKVLGLYDRDGRVLRHLTVEEIPMLVLWALLGTALLSLFLSLAPSGRPDAASAIQAGIVAGFSVILLRAAARLLWRHVVPPTRIAVVGTVSTAGVLRRKLELFPDVHAEIIGVYDPADLDVIAQRPAGRRSRPDLLRARVARRGRGARGARHRQGGWAPSSA